MQESTQNGSKDSQPFLPQRFNDYSPSYVISESLSDKNSFFIQLKLLKIIFKFFLFSLQELSSPVQDQIIFIKEKQESILKSLETGKSSIKTLISIKI